MRKHSQYVTTKTQQLNWGPPTAEQGLLPGVFSHEDVPRSQVAFCITGFAAAPPCGCSVCTHAHTRTHTRTHAPQTHTCKHTYHKHTTNMYTQTYTHTTNANTNTPQIRTHTTCTHTPTAGVPLLGFCQLLTQ